MILGEFVDHDAREVPALNVFFYLVLISRIRCFSAIVLEVKILVLRCLMRYRINSF
jgi:hypothetical protein